MIPLNYPRCAVPPANNPAMPAAPRTLRKEMLMMNVRNTLIGLVASALLAWIVVSCGGGGGGGYGGGSGSGGMPAPTYSVGGTLSSATGTVVLKLNGGEDMSMSNGPFTFATTLHYLATYNVQVVDANDR